MNWTYNNKDFTSDDIQGYYGFVYCITNIETSKRYIGKKFFWKKITRPPLKGSTRKRHELVESDWKTYWSSSPSLLKEIEILGIEKYRREILSLHPNKQETNYNELRLQILLDVLDSKSATGEYLFYNENILSKYYRTKRQDVHDNRIETLIKYKNI